MQLTYDAGLRAPDPSMTPDEILGRQYDIMVIQGRARVSQIIQSSGDRAFAEGVRAGVRGGTFVVSLGLIIILCVLGAAGTLSLNV